MHRLAGRSLESASRLDPDDRKRLDTLFSLGAMSLGATAPDPSRIRAD
jgi:hypothetical protein